MYSRKYQQKYLKGTISPHFRICLQKAFEVVALFGPLIYNRNPHRACKPPQPNEFTPMDFGDPNDPSVMAMYEQAMMREQMRESNAKTRCGGTEKYLNYTAREQPDGGLKQAGEFAVTEALIKGRGLLWPETYSRPGSEQILTGCFYDSVDRLLIDPDAESSTFGKAYWIAREHLEPHWVTERRFNLPFGTLRNKVGGLESSNAQGARKANRVGNLHRQAGRTFDLCKWHEIWSIGGVGTRLTGTSKIMQNAFDEVVGDYAYICVASGYDSPLNAPRTMMLEAADDDVAEAFAWPIPTWADGRWPVAMLDFYNKPNEAWPIAPVAPGLGELTAVNIIFSQLVEQVWSNSQQLIAVLKSAQKDVETALRKQTGPIVLGIPDIMKDINHMISFLHRPDAKYEMWQVIDMLFTLFDKRVGLADMLYGMSAHATPRTATDVRTKDEKLSIRPDHMATKVEEWLTEASTLEKITAYFGGVSGNDVLPLMGEVGAHLFEKHFTNAAPEAILGETDCTIEVGSARKPNKARDLENIQTIYPAMSQEFSKHADMTADTGPINELHQKMGKAMEEDVSGLMMGPRMPPPPPPNQGPDPEVEAKQAKLDIDVADHTEDLEFSEDIHAQTLRHKEAEHKAAMARELAKLKLARSKKHASV
ncbi:MAG: hypothetical protein U9Q82_11280 [Chloroflexota bacterium]|nr:hypothetical protein [Chloroflexota bacterium]